MRTCNWRIELSLIPASDAAEPDGHIGCMEPYAILYEALDRISFSGKSAMTVSYRAGPGGGQV
jgi:hypothetical protein